MLSHEDFISKLTRIGISSEKQSEILKNSRVKDTLYMLLSQFPENKLLYVLASKLPKSIEFESKDLLEIGKLINENIILQEKQIIGSLEYLKIHNSGVGLSEYIKQFNKTDSEIRKVIVSAYSPGFTKKEFSKIINNIEEIKYCSSSVVNKMIDEVLENNKHKNNLCCEDIKNSLNETITKNPEDIYSWLKEGELSKIHTPQTNPLNDKVTLDEHLKRTNGKVITRFPPEPNGYLHIGHAKALNLSYNFCKMNNGDFILRFDDTNPKNEKSEFYEMIEKDIRWLLQPKISNTFKKIEKDSGLELEDNKSCKIEPNIKSTDYLKESNITGKKILKNDNDLIFSRITNASDYFDKFIEFGMKLIEIDKAFACNQTQEEMKLCRETNTESPFRNRSKEFNKILFQEMISGKWKEGTISLRLKQDIKSPNPLMHDLVAFRVIDSEKSPHCKTNNKYHVYPAYDFTHCINDSLEDITHSFCSREFYNRKETYYWVLDALKLYKPVQWEFSRLKITNVMLSKRKITELVENNIVDGWDDPRLYTICGLRRRGFTNIGINNFVKNVGITFNTSTIDIKLLENYVREDLEVVSERMNCIVEPLLLKIVKGGKIVKEIFIEKSDFEENGDKNFLRFTRKQSVGLLNLLKIKFVEKKDEYIVVEETDEKPRKWIHWVEKNNCEKIQLRLYDSLFIDEKLNKYSLVVKDGYCEKEIINRKIGDHIQFRRVGFFCIDKDSKKDLIVLNLTLPLKNPTWK